MNAFIQDDSLLIGAENEIENLAKKNSAKILVVSDSHGSYQSLKMILHQTPCDAMIFCGDGFCDIARLIDETAENENLQKFIPGVIGVVEGNNDADIYPVRNISSTDPYYIEFKIPLFNTIEICGKKIFFTHGHRNAVYIGCDQVVALAKKYECEIALYGHTHVASEQFFLGDVLALNPGSCARPRCGQFPSFATLEISREKNYVLPIFYQIASQKIKPFHLENS